MQEQRDLAELQMIHNSTWKNFVDTAAIGYMNDIWPSALKNPGPSSERVVRFHAALS